MASRRLILPTLLVLWAGAACSSEPTSSTPDQSGAVAAITSCQADAAQIEALIGTVFATGPNKNSALGKWNNVIKQIDRRNNLRIAQNRVLDLVDFMLKKRAQGQIIIDDATFTNLVNQLLCYVGLGGVTNPDDTWIVNPGDTILTFVTADGQSGIQFPSNAVSELTLVTAVRSTEAALVTELDKYPFVYDWNLLPAQTLQNGAKATVGVCPNPASFNDVPLAERQAVLNRLVLGHQRNATAFEVLQRVPIPAAMTLTCGDISDLASSGSVIPEFARRMVNWLLPRPAMAAAVRLASGGVGGNTSEFSPFGPVDPELRVGGVGGNTSEFSRLDAAAVAMPTSPYAGTVGTQRTSGVLPAVTIATRRGTPIPGVLVTWTASAPATQTPAGNASVCGADAQTNAAGAAQVHCLHFGTTVNIPIAYTKVKATFAPPTHLATIGQPVITFEPAFQTWLIESHGATDMVFTLPPAGRTVALNNPYYTTDQIQVQVEIRSALGEVVPIATQTASLILNKNAFGQGTVASKAAVAGVANFTVTVPTAATGYRMVALATLTGNSIFEARSNFFDVVSAPVTSSVTAAPQN